MLTQRAISHTISLMIKDGLIEKHALSDGRKSGICLSEQSQSLLEVLQPQWASTFAAIERLSAEVDAPLLKVFEAVAQALNRKGYNLRISEEAEFRRVSSGVSETSAALDGSCQ